MTLSVSRSTFTSSWSVISQTSRYEAEDSKIVSMEELMNPEGYAAALPGAWSKQHMWHFADAEIPGSRPRGCHKSEINVLLLNSALRYKL